MGGKGFSQIAPGTYGGGGGGVGANPANELLRVMMFQDLRKSRQVAQQQREEQIRLKMEQDRERLEKSGLEKAQAQVREEAGVDIVKDPEMARLFAPAMETATRTTGREFVTPSGNIVSAPMFAPSPEQISGATTRVRSAAAAYREQQIADMVREQGLDPEQASYLRARVAHGELAKPSVTMGELAKTATEAIVPITKKVEALKAYKEGREVAGAIPLAEEAGRAVEAGKISSAEKIASEAEKAKVEAAYAEPMARLKKDVEETTLALRRGEAAMLPDKARELRASIQEKQLRMQQTQQLINDHARASAAIAVWEKNPTPENLKKAMVAGGHVGEAARIDVENSRQYITSMKEVITGQKALAEQLKAGEVAEPYARTTTDMLNRTSIHAADLVGSETTNFMSLVKVPGFTHGYTLTPTQSIVATDAAKLYTSGVLGQIASGKIKGVWRGTRDNPRFLGAPEALRIQASLEYSIPGNSSDIIPILDNYKNVYPPDVIEQAKNAIVGKGEATISSEGQVKKLTPYPSYPGVYPGQPQIGPTPGETEHTRKMQQLRKLVPLEQ